MILPNQKPMITTYKRSYASCDISDAAATSFEKFKAPFAGRVNVAASYIVWDAEATGAQTTQGVLALEVATVEVGTLTAARSGATGDVQPFVVNGTTVTAASPYAEFAAGDLIEIEVKQAAVTNAEGDGYAYIAIDYAI